MPSATDRLEAFGAAHSRGFTFLAAPAPFPARRAPLWPRASQFDLAARSRLSRRAKRAAPSLAGRSGPIGLAKLELGFDSDSELELGPELARPFD